MALERATIRPIPLENLLIDLQNPRFDPRKNQREAITTIALHQGVKLANLADDIIEKGLNPSELPIVTPSGDANTYVVLEGNRRIAALKLMASPSLASSIGLPDHFARRYKFLHEEAKGRLLREIDCVVLSREDASHWILVRHTGENQGVGVVTWDGLQTQRFRGSSPALQAIELVKASDYLDEATRRKLPKIHITNIERILGTPEARKHLGVEVKAGQLILKPPEEEAVARLAIVVGNVANQHVKVSQLDTREQRVEYALQVSSRPLPKPIAPPGREVETADEGAPADTTGLAAKWIPPDRRVLIPLRFKLAIPQTRMNKIYHELQKLNVESFVNCVGVMFRVFLELSVDDFAQRHGIFLKVATRAKRAPARARPQTRDMTLREKLKVTADFLYDHSLCTKAELRGARTLIANRDHVLSVDSLNAYIHNKDYSPTPTDLKTTWDNLQVFIERIWTT